MKQKSKENKDTCLSFKNSFRTENAHSQISCNTYHTFLLAKKSSQNATVGKLFKKFLCNDKNDQLPKHEKD